MLNLRNFGFSAIGILILSASISAQDDNSALRNIDSLYVLVDDNDDANCISGKNVKASASRILRDAGIRVLTEKEWRQHPRQPTLFVEINTSPLKLNWGDGTPLQLNHWIYHVRIEVREIVDVQGRSPKRRMAALWKVGQTGYTNQNAFMNSVINNAFRYLITKWTKENSR